MRVLRILKERQWPCTGLWNLWKKCMHVQSLTIYTWEKLRESFLGRKLAHERVEKFAPAYDKLVHDILQKSNYEGGTLTGGR